MWPFPWNIVVGIGAPVVAILVWALFVSPRAVFEVHPFVRAVVELLVYVSATLALVEHGAHLGRTGLRRRRGDGGRPGRSAPPRVSDAAEVLALLRAALGDRVDTAPASLAAARADKSGHAAAGTPLAVVHAASVADVQETLRIATRDPHAGRHARRRHGPGRRRERGRG